MLFSFYEEPWENAQQPSLVRDDPHGGDPRILAVLARVCLPNDLHELCHRANAAGDMREALSAIDAMPLYTGHVPPEQIPGLVARYNKALSLAAAALGNDPRGEQVGRAPPCAPDVSTAPGGPLLSNKGETHDN